MITIIVYILIIFDAWKLFMNIVHVPKITVKWESPILETVH